MSMLFAPITVLLIVAHLDPVNGRPHSKHHDHSKYVEDDKKDYSWAEADGYEECDEFLKFRKGPKPKPMSEICGHLQYGCVPYKELDPSGCGYAQRILLSGNWTTTYIDMTAENGYYDAYMRLHGYRKGIKNKIGKFLGMNVPVMKEWRIDSNDKVMNATMSFYIPEPYQSNPPASSDPNVEVEEWPDMVIYSRAYGGNRQDPEHLEQFVHLKKALAKENIATVPGMRMTAGFTSPRYGSQRREVILFGLPTAEEEEESA